MQSKAVRRCAMACPCPHPDQPCFHPPRPRCSVVANGRLGAETWSRTGPGLARPRQAAGRQQAGQTATTPARLVQPLSVPAGTPVCHEPRCRVAARLPRSSSVCSPCRSTALLSSFPNRPRPSAEAGERWRERAIGLERSLQTCIVVRAAHQPKRQCLWGILLLFVGRPRPPCRFCATLSLILSMPSRRWNSPLPSLLSHQLGTAAAPPAGRSGRAVCHSLSLRLFAP